MQKYFSLALLVLLLTTFYLSVHKKESPNSQFLKWKTQFEISYDSELEEIYRQRVFYENLLLIEQHNADPAATYKMGVNQFTGLTKEEFVELYLGTIHTVNTNNVIHVEEKNEDLKAEIDWVLLGAVNPPKNQGQCSSCWAFSTTGTLEGLCKISTGILRSFSEQQLVDCSGRYGNMGCNGGTMTNAFKYVKQNKICDDLNYTYKGAKQDCKYGTCTQPFAIAGYVSVTGCSQLLNALSGRPISVTVDATNWSSYSSGVFNKCGTNLNHGVVLVGHAGGSWKIKNSWGSVWGERGFIRISDGNTCGVCQTGLYATVPA